MSACVSEKLSEYPVEHCLWKNAFRRTATRWCVGFFKTSLANPKHDLPKTSVKNGVSEFFIRPLLKEEAVHRFIDDDGEEAPERANDEFTKYNTEEKRNRFPMQADAAVFQHEPLEQPTDKN